MTAKLCWVVMWWSPQFVVLMYKPERERAFLIICERHSINLAKGNQGRSCRALKRFDSKNEFDPDEGWRNRDREEVVGANLSWQPCDFHSDWLFKARLEAWRIFTSFPAKKSISPLHMIIVGTNVLNQLRVMVVGLGGWRVGDLREMAATLRVRRSLL